MTKLATGEMGFMVCLMDVSYLLISALKEETDGFRSSYLFINISVFTSQKSLNGSQIFR